MDFDNRSDIYDEATIMESIASNDAFSALGILGNPKDFRHVCESYDALLGYKTPLPPTSNIATDRIRGWYALFTAYVLRITRLEIDELARVMDTLMEVRSKENRREPLSDATVLERTIIAFCRYPRFEPRWHMRRRGDDRPLPASKDKDLWGFLLNLYTKPEYSRMRMPDNIRRVGAMYKGYDDCVKRAVADGHEELKRIYGPDVDLSPVTEVKKPVDDDYDGVSFMRLLQNGAPMFSSVPQE